MISIIMPIIQTSAIFALVVLNVLSDTESNSDDDYINPRTHIRNNFGHYYGQDTIY